MSWKRNFVNIKLNMHIYVCGLVGVGVGVGRFDSN
jgi:hypothetical protein